MSTDPLRINALGASGPLFFKTDTQMRNILGVSQHSYIKKRTVLTPPERLYSRREQGKGKTMARRIRDVLAGLEALHKAAELRERINAKADEARQTTLEEALQQDRKPDAQEERASQSDERRHPPVNR